LRTRETPFTPFPFGLGARELLGDIFFNLLDRLCYLIYRSSILS